MVEGGWGGGRGGGGGRGRERRERGRGRAVAKPEDWDPDRVAALGLMGCDECAGGGEHECGEGGRG